MAAMTDREEIEPWEERKSEHRARVERAGSEACAIYGADKLAGIREAREGYSEVGELVEERLGNSLELRIAVSRDDLAMLEGSPGPTLAFIPEIREELAKLLDDRRGERHRSENAAARAR